MQQLPRVLLAAVATITGMLPATLSAAATPTITQVSPPTAEIDNPAQTFTFTTAATYSSTFKPSVTITRSATASGSSPETFTGGSVTVSGNQVSATFDLDRANPGAYDAKVSGPTTSPPAPSTTNSCTSCVTLTSNPTVTTVSPATTGADFFYFPFIINGSDFAAGPYSQCRALPCSTTSPNVAIYNGAALDTDVWFDDSNNNSTSTKLELPMTINPTDTGGYRTIKITNIDGHVGTCTNCLHIAPAMTVTSVSPSHLSSGSSGQSILIQGTNFPSDTTVQFTRRSNGATTDVTWSHEQVSTDGKQILLTGVAVAATAPDGDEDLRLTSTANNFSHKFPAQFAVGAQPPSGSSEAAPTNVTATARDQQAFVQWNPPASASGDPITGYTVQTLPSGPTIAASPAARAATVSPLTNGTSYTFTVTVTFQSGNTHTSAPSNAVTPATAPDAPIGVKASAGDNKAKVTWTAPASPNNAAIDRYTITASPGGQHAVVLAQNNQPPATTGVVSGLKNGTTYTFTVTAHNSVGDSKPSAPSNAVTPKGNPSLTLLGPGKIHKGSAARLHGQLVDSNGKAVAGAKVKLLQRHAGAHQFGPVKTLTTSKRGRWSFDVSPKVTTRYKIKWAGNAGNTKVATGHTVKVVTP